MDMFGIDKEIADLKKRFTELDVLLKLLIATGIRSNSIQAGLNDYDKEIEHISLIFNKLQEKINNAKRSD